MTKNNDDCITNSSLNEILTHQFKIFRKEVNLDFKRIVTDMVNDFFEKIDPILKEVAASCEERVILSAKMSDHSDRIEKLDEVVFKN